MNTYDTPVTEVINVEITPIMENTNPGGGENPDPGEDWG